MHLIYFGIAFVPILLIAIVLQLAARKPPVFRVERSIHIASRPDVPFNAVNDLHRWDEWSPWAKLDPAMKVTFDGSPTDPGSSMEWEGNSKVGKGKTTVVETRPGEMVRLKLEFMRPFKATNEASFTFTPTGTQTHVIWAMTGNCNLVMRVFYVFMNMDKMIGRDFEKGLTNLKAVSETPDSV